MNRFVRKFLSRRGNAVVELGLMLPIATGAMVFVADVGTAAYRNMALKSAVRAGADYVLRTNDTAGVPAVVAAAASSDPNAVNVTTAQSCGCAAITVTCGGVCPDGSNQQVYMTVAVSQAYTPMFPSQAFGHGGAPTVLAAQATFRTK